MPILDIEVVCTAAEAAALPPASAVASAAGKVMGTAPGKTWIKLHALDRRFYAENESDAPSPGPVFVTVTQSRPPAGAELEAQVVALTQAIAAALGRPVEIVHVEVRPAALGRIAFGGRLVR